MHDYGLIGLYVTVILGIIGLASQTFILWGGVRTEVRALSAKFDEINRTLGAHGEAIQTLKQEKRLVVTS